MLSAMLFYLDLTKFWINGAALPLPGKPIDRAASGERHRSFLGHQTATLTYGGYSADNRQVQGVPRQGAETPPAREKMGRGNPSNLIRVVPA